MLFAWTIAACTVQLPEPTLLAVEPSRGWNGEDTVISIEGRGFVPQVQVNVNRGGQTDLDRGYVARLDGTSGQFVLSSVSAVDYEHLRAVVDPGLPPGRYDLVVEGPTGRIASLEDAYTVGATRADRLSLDTSVIATVNTATPVTITVLDPDGAPVQDDLLVRITFSDTVEGPFAGSIGLGLDDQASGSDGVVTGSLGPDGVAVVPLTVHRPGTVTIRAEALGPDDQVREDTLAQAWLPGSDLVVAIERLDPDVQPLVGEPLDLVVRLEDQFGNLVTNGNTNVTLQMACGADVTSLVLNGEQQTTITPTVATDFSSPCQEQFVRSVAGPSGRSAGFAIRAGVATNLSVRNIITSTPRAGEAFIALVGARDAYGNRTLLPVGVDDVVLQDSVGGLGPTSCVLLSEGDLNCSATMTVAGDRLRTTAVAGAVSGRGEPYDLLPGNEVGSLEVELTGPVRSDDLVDLLVTASDLYGNRIPADTLDLTVTTEGDDLCGTPTTRADGRGVVSCRFRAARPNATVLVTADGTTEDLQFQVTNGPPAQAELVSPTEVVAGETFGVDVAVSDAYGNPVLVPDGALEIRDERGVAAESLTLIDGEATASLSLTIAGPDALQVFADGQAIGSPVVVQVAAGPAVGLRITSDEPWVFVGDEIDVRVESVDAFGNRALSTEAVTLESSLGVVQTGQLVGGSAQIPYTWTFAALGSTLTASTPMLSGQLQGLDVVRGCSADGPLAAVSFAGAPVGRACSDPTSAPVAVQLSMAGSTQGLAPLSDYRAAIDDERFDSDVPTFTVPVEGVGRTAVRALVVDDDLCASEVATAVWSGPDDGSPVGRLDIVAPATATLGDVVPVTVEGAVDCRGNAAAGADVRVRTDRGELVGTTPTGTGQTVTLGLLGTGSFALDLLARTGGDTTVALSTASGGASGEAVVTVTGDVQGPLVWELNASNPPLADAVVLRFSEPLAPATVLPAAFTVTSTTVSTVTVTQPSASTVRLAFDTPVDLDAGILGVQVAASVTDLDGNPLEGTYAAVAAPWNGALGGLAPAPDPVTCTVEPTTFRPDGDPGVGIEADRVEVVVSSTSTPAFWSVSVRDDAGTLLRRERIVPVGPDDTWFWDGRGVDDRIQPDGLYTIDLRADNGLGRTTGGCLAPVTIDNERDDG